MDKLQNNTQDPIIIEDYRDRLIDCAQCLNKQHCDDYANGVRYRTNCTMHNTKGVEE